VKISILCSDPNHPIFPWLERWSLKQGHMHKVRLNRNKDELIGGDILFLISCHEVIFPQVRAQYAATLVIHASDLPIGRGWSPHIWQIIEGNNRIPVTLLEAEDAIDSGAIWAQRHIQLDGHETFEEINAKLFDAEVELMDFAVEGFNAIKPRQQDGRVPTIYRKRTPEDSRIDPHKSIADQFELLRVADPMRFPAFMEYRGHRYLISIVKDQEHGKN
jgi:methionyl-tRNA formyltransferase